MIAAMNNGSLMLAGRRKRRAAVSSELTSLATSASATTTCANSIQSATSNTKLTSVAARPIDNMGQPTYNNYSNDNDKDNTRLSSGGSSVKKARTNREPASDDKRASSLLDVKTGNRTSTNTASSVRATTSTGSTVSELSGKLVYLHSLSFQCFSGLVVCMLMVSMVPTIRES